MIYCIRFAQLEAELARIGFVLVSRTEATLIYERADGRRFQTRAPNVSGAVPEAVANDAFDTAGLTPPAWDVFWCD